MFSLGVSNLINVILLAATISVAIWSFWSMRKEQWVAVYFEFNKRYANIRWRFPNEILSESFDVSRLEKNQRLLKLMRRYFDLCSEEFYLKNAKKWIEEQLWKEWEQGIRYYLGKQVFRKAWRRIRDEEDYYTDFKRFMNEAASIE